MLSKKVCKACVNKYRNTIQITFSKPINYSVYYNVRPSHTIPMRVPWGDNDEKYWDDGLIHCGNYPDGNEQHTCRLGDGIPPECRCRLEQMMDMQEKNET